MLPTFLAALLLLIGCIATSRAQDVCGSPHLDSIGNGYCDATNNNPECDYDGGDCCPCTCEEGPGACTYFEPGCLDPEAPCYDSAAACDASGGQSYTRSDGYCDVFNNIPDCDYDGGDCCPCSCEPGPGACTYFDPGCIDPDVWCTSPIATGDGGDAVGGSGSSSSSNSSTGSGSGSGSGSGE